MNILLTNDDGIHADGLAALRSAAAAFGDVHVMAPSTERSGVGHGITLTGPLRVSEVNRNGGFFGYAVTGTPADCVKFALGSSVVPRPDLILSGVNFGGNLGIHVLYSGTVAAAIEGAILGVPSIAISVAFGEHIDFGTAAQVGCDVIRPYVAHLASGGEGPPALNVNVPPVPRDQIRGVRMTRQCLQPFSETIEKFRDPWGRDYYWIGGGEMEEPVEEDSDLAAIRERWVTVTPLHFDMTDHEWLAKMTPGDLGDIRAGDAEG